MTRREKFDQARKDAFLSYLSQGVRRTHACQKAGICRETFNRHFNNNKQFAAAVLQAEMDSFELVEQAMFKTALDGNVTAQQVILYNRCPDRWADRRNLVLAGDKNAPIHVVTQDLSKLSDEELSRLEELVAKLESDPTGKSQT